MGIKHLSDLSPSNYLRVLQLEWNTSIKLDGSFIQFGLDEHGDFYTARKGNERYYDVDEWPDMPWCNGFRAAHVALHSFIDGLQEEGDFQPGDTFEAEIIWQHRPNTIMYQTNNMLAITKSPVPFEFGDDRKMSDRPHWITSFGGACARVSVWATADGVELHKETRNQRWVIASVEHLHRGPLFVRRMLEITQRQVHNELNDWLSMPTALEGVTRLQLLECKLNRRPDFVPEEMWRSPARSVMVAQIKHYREQLQEHWSRLACFNSNTLLHRLADLLKLGSEEHEGFVARTPEGDVFKLVNRAEFSMANKLSHWVRYVLQGGSRPPKPSFMSRTKDWPVERRLARLETLRKRYIAQHKRLGYYGRDITVSYEDPDLHQRTLLLFAELRVRIAHGR